MTPRHILLLGATGTIGRAVAAELAARGHTVTAVLRDPAAALPPAVARRIADVTIPGALAATLGGERFDILISCLASRSGSAAESADIDHRANSLALAAAPGAGVGQFILLSAICVQKPRLPFQHAKLAFEAELIASGMPYTIVRPTAFFKSLSGQLRRVTQGKRILLFGNGDLTACKPISDGDLARFIAGCIDDPAAANRTLPIGGPGPAQTPRQQWEDLFQRLGRPPRFRRVPVGVMDAIVTLLAIGAPFSSRMAAAADYARIGRYYATESMLHWNPATGRYDADATPETGTERLLDHQLAVIAALRDAAPPR
ncbi:NAD(P)H-binding protein [Sandaracinobacteroides saxicola]|uniref:Divinyl chlorophyllide a 8-vinyl-reductase, chloroplastic n=1 Tax=Sandaracinobacteroides saxicola TaxID=2759707 RepID=A0A7G5IL43_9SPHN|nr:NAD(P)H-binding protein [Sandaracinobacteroides saxicola]QMW24085.1 NAD(P)H-binding protein [Sandaracinobacteroides saxicola]